MGSSTLTYLQDLQTSGLNLINYYDDVYPANVYGSWGSMESLYSTTSPKYNALLKFVSTTPPILDTTPPSISTNLSATSNSSSAISLTWSASTDNVGVQGYRIFRNGEQIGFVGSTTLSYGDIGLAASTTYAYSVNAYDAAGNQSAQSSSSNATTKMICGTQSSPFGLDGVGISTAAGSNDATATVQLTTSQNNDVIMLMIAQNGGAQSVTDVEDLNWTKRYDNSSYNGSDFQEWYAIANCPLSSDTITVSSQASNMVSPRLNAFAVSGASTSTIFDPNGSLPAATSTDTLSLSTSNANDFIFTAIRTFSGITDSAGSGWTQLATTNNNNGGYFSEYQIATSTETNLTASFTELDSGTYMIGDAIRKAP